MKTKVQPHADQDWARLLETERALEGEIAAAEADARARVGEARAAAAAVPDPAAIAAQAAEEEQADTEVHRSLLAGIADEADAAVRALTEAPESLIDALAQIVLDAALTDVLPAPRR